MKTYLGDKNMRKLLYVILCISFTASVSYGQVRIQDRALAMSMRPAVPNNIFPNTASMIAGNLWDSFMPISTGVYYSEIANNPTHLWDLVRVGNFDRQWSTPTVMWPGGYPYSYYWNQDLISVEYSPGINPTKQVSASADYAAMIWTSHVDSLWQATLGLHSYVIGPIWVNPDGTPDQNGTKRYELYYEAGFPTNLGIWVTFRAIQYTQPWDQFNDFIIFGVTFKNYGLLDVAADGHPTSTNNKINALTFGWFSGDMQAAQISTAGYRGANSFGDARMSGFIADNDPSGVPWATQVGYAGVNPVNYPSYPNGTVPAGKHDMGLNAYTYGFYSDVWFGKTWLGVKADSLGLPGAPDAQTIFGTDPVGKGAQHGWFMSSGTGLGNLDNRLDASVMHTDFMGEFYQDGGKSNDASKLNLNPNPNFFQPGGTAGNPLTFVPKASPSQPDGDKKSTNSLQNIWEPGWTKGYSISTNFDGDSFIGTGPYALDVGQSITVVGAEYAGFRMQGMLNSLQSARYAWQNGGVPAGPAAPDIQTLITPGDNKVQVEWTKVPNETSDPNFGGYKIYRASAFPTFNSTVLGLRTMQHYTDQMHAGDIDASYFDPINPNFDATGSLKTMQAGYWGPWRIQAVIPKDSLQKYAHTDGNYSYAFKDNALDVILGFSYWYYVAAYDNVPSMTFNGETTTHLESGRVNENGASGMWVGTFPWATQNSFYPKDVSNLKAIGATVVVQSAPVNPQSLASGTVKIGVRPNPYKKQAFQDVGLEHKIMFYNLPSTCTITILDVSGQIVDQINYAAPTPTNGTFFWDMFSKDGIEVANGLYIYVVQYSGGQQTGYFAILR